MTRSVWQQPTMFDWMVDWKLIKFDWTFYAKENLQGLRNDHLNFAHFGLTYHTKENLQGRFNRCLCFRLI